MAKPKEPQTQTQLQEAAVEIPRLPPNRFSHWVEQAFERTDAQHKRYLKDGLGNMSSADYLDMLQSDIGYTNEYTNVARLADVRELAKAIKGYQQDFHAGIAAARDTKSLFKRCESYVEDEQYKLFYQTNDVVAARLKQDYFNNFLDQLLPTLEADGLLDERMKTRFADLKEAYKLGFHSYDVSKMEISSLSEGRADTLLEDAHSRLLDQYKKAPPDKFALMLEEEALRSANAIVKATYLLDLGDLPVPPPLFAILHQARALTQAKLKHQHPNTDLRDPKQAAVFEEFDDIYKSISLHVSKRLFSSPVSLLNLARTSRELTQLMQHIDGTPENFSAMIEDARLKAAKTVLGRSGEYLKKDKERYKLNASEMIPLPKSYAIIDTMLPGWKSAKKIESDTRRFISQTGMLPKAQTKTILLHSLEECAVGVLDEGMFGFTHPASLLAAKDFLAEFRRNIGQAMHDAGCYDANFIENIKKAEETVAHAYKSRNIAGEWLLEETGGGIDDMFHAAWLKQGWKPDKLTFKEVGQLMKIARSNLRDLSGKRGIRNELQEVPVIPLIYDRCHGIAVAEYDKEVASEYKKQEQEYWSKLVRPSRRRAQQAAKTVSTEPAPDPAAESPAIPEGAYKGAIPSEEQTKELVIRQRTLQIMDEALDRVTFPPVPPAPDAPKDTPATIMQPHLNPHTLDILFDYLNVREQKALRPAKRDITLH